MLVLWRLFGLLVRKSGVLVGGSQLEGWTKRVGFVVTFRLAGAEKAVFKVLVSSWGHEYPHRPDTRADQRAPGPDNSHLGPTTRTWARQLARGPDNSHVGPTTRTWDR